MPFRVKHFVYVTQIDDEEIKSFHSISYVGSALDLMKLVESARFLKGDFDTFKVVKKFFINKRLIATEEMECYGNLHDYEKVA